jgi:hypothetical protein
VHGSPVADRSFVVLRVDLVVGCFHLSLRRKR